VNPQLRGWIVPAVLVLLVALVVAGGLLR